MGPQVASQPKTRPHVVPTVLLQHAEDAAALHGARSLLVSAPHVRLGRIARFDERISAHLDGLIVAGNHSWSALEASLASPSAGKTFAAASFAIACKSADHLIRLTALVEAVPSLTQGLVSAFGWAERSLLRGTVSSLLASQSAFSIFLGICACAVHRADPARALHTAISFGGRACTRSLRAAGELGRRDLVRVCLSKLETDDESVRFWGAWSAVLLGDRVAGISALKAIGEAPGSFKSRAARLVLQVIEQSEAAEWLQRLGAENVRSAIQGAGVAGDAGYAPWLIDHMSDKKTSRIAGEAFSLITGLDLAYLDLDQKPPGETSVGPNDDPDDPNVEMDEDDGLAWPDPDRISKWWQDNGNRFTPGRRYFMGGPVARENCLRVLKDGFQRQRILAAHYLCLLEPGTPLFEWRAPAFRQQQQLSSMR